MEKCEGQNEVIGITVTPTRRNGQDVFCRITGPTEYVRGSVIFLPSNADDVELNFTLVDGGGVPLEWDETGPFSSKENECPEPTEHDAQLPSDGIQVLQDNVLRVRVRGNQNPSVLHYSLNFKAGGSQCRCDPIIIRDSQ